MNKHKKAQIIKEDTELAKITTQNLREVLWDEIDLLRAGKISKERANTVCKMAHQILESLRMEVQNKWTSILIKETKLLSTINAEDAEEIR